MTRNFLYLAHVFFEIVPILDSNPLFRGDFQGHKKSNYFTNR